MNDQLNWQPQLRNRFSTLAFLGALIGVVLAGLPSIGRAAAGPTTMDLIVERYRQVIVLMDGEDALDRATRERARMVGKILFHQQLGQRERLTRQLADEIAEAVPLQAELPATSRFLDRLEHDAAWHDADKLAFREVLADLAAEVQAVQPANPASRKLQRRIADDRASLQQIQSRYEKELAQVFDALGTRAMPQRREAWDAYTTFLAGLYQRDAILREFDEALEGEGGTRGAGSGESALETFGRRLPEKTLLLTFDDGPHPRYSDRILEILQRYGLSGVFFHVGQNLGRIGADGSIKLDRRADISRRILAAGSALANHSYTHALLPKLDSATLDREIDQTHSLLQSIDPSATPLFRAPYGARNANVLSAIESRSLRSVQWNIDSEDWADPVASSVAARVIAEVRRQGRGIVLFHDIHDRVIEALPTVIDTLLAEGYRFAHWDGNDFVLADSAVAPTAPSRAVSLPVQADDGAAPYGESWAVVVGIDGYTTWPKLQYAVRDAQGVRDLLVKQFAFKEDHVFTLYNGEATREAILSLLGDKLGNPALVGRNDRVFVFFAGHGATRQLASGRDLGYIIPVDADLSNYQGRAISMTNFQDIAEAIPAKHVLFVMDSCYSGLGLTRGAGGLVGSNYLQEIARRSARQMFTAGGADQQVSDAGPNGHSVFTWTLLRALGGEGDLNGDGVITASELATWASPLVSAMSQQTPAFGNLPGSEGGEFFFELRGRGDSSNALSEQLDAAAGQLNNELAALREEIDRKSQRNSALAQQLAEARRTLAALEGQHGATRSAASTEQAIQLNEQGMAHYQAKDYSAALGSFLAAAQLDPAYALAANNVGFVYFKLGRLQDAAEWYERTLRIDPQRAVAWLNAGDAYLALGQRENAERAFNEYLQLNPTAKAAAYAREQLDHLQSADDVPGDSAGDRAAATRVDG